MYIFNYQEIRQSWLDFITEFMKYKQHFDTAYLLMACFAIAEDIPNNIIRIMVRNNFETVISSL
jgi:GTP-binding protein EngB required for normal cell division